MLQTLNRLVSNVSFETKKRSGIQDEVAAIFHFPNPRKT